MNVSPVIDLQNVSKLFPNPSGSVTSVLQDVSLSIFSQETISIVGASGSGKSTLLNLVGGLSSPTQGAIFWNQQRVDQFSNNQRSSLRRNFISFVFQTANLLPELTAFENILFPLRILNKKIKDFYTATDTLLRQLQIEKCRDQIPENLSGGERQRVAIARALVTQPKLVIADEPTGNLDEQNAHNVIHLLLDLCHQSKTSLLLVTHNPLFAKMMDRSFLLRNGQLVPIGSSN